MAPALLSVQRVTLSLMWLALLQVPEAIRKFEELGGQSSKTSDHMQSLLSSDPDNTDPASATKPKSFDNVLETHFTEEAEQIKQEELDQWWEAQIAQVANKGISILFPEKKAADGTKIPTMQVTDDEGTTYYQKAGRAQEWKVVPEHLLQ